MIQFTLRLIAILTLLTFAVILIARAQPYDDGGLREMLFPNDCKPPCFMGIRPGITRQEQAVELLKKSPWVANVTTLRNQREIIWDWNGRQPALLRNSRTENAILFSDSDLVYRINILTSANIGTFTLLLGAPDGWLIGSFGMRTSPPKLTQIATYATYPLTLSGQADCPISLHDQWSLPLQISLYDVYDNVGGIWGVTLPELRSLAENNC